MTSYYTWKQDPYECSGCGWKGTGEQCTTTLLLDLFEIRCPSCGNMVGVMQWPTFEDSRQHWDMLSESEKKLVEFGEAQQKEILSRRLTSPTQLPDIEGDNLVFTWDIEDLQMGGDTLLGYGGEIIWREPAIYEGYGRFLEVAWILKEKYGDRMQDLVPTEKSLLYLWGDRLTAPDIIEERRSKLRDRSS